MRTRLGSSHPNDSADMNSDCASAGWGDCRSDFVHLWVSELTKRGQTLPLLAHMRNVGEPRRLPLAEALRTRFAHCETFAF
jgi:hypothetical protein